MAEYLRTFELGAAKVAVINIYEIPADLNELAGAAGGERSREEPAAPRIEQLAVQCIYVQTPDLSVLVDASAYDAAHDSSGRGDYQPPPGLLAGLAELGVRPEDVGHVVITHAHGDHFNATTAERGGAYVPAFPNARYYLGRGDWESPRLQEALGTPDSLESRAFAPLHRAGALVPVEGDRELGNGVTILAAPGETPGHQLLRVESEGQTLYCIGDLYHHPIEVKRPERMPPWADPAPNGRSRESLVEVALAENARLIATHIPGVGRLERGAEGVTWVRTEG